MKFKRTFVIDEDDYKEFNKICLERGLEKSAQIRLLIKIFNEQYDRHKLNVFKIFK